MEDDLNFWKMKDDLNIFGNGRRPQYVEKWKTTPICRQIENNINFGKWKATSIF
jgi:hypothetical protein